MAKKSTHRPHRSSRATAHRPAQENGSGSKQLEAMGRVWGSGSGLCPPCRFFPKDYPLPVELILRLDAPVDGGSAASRQQLNRPAFLIYAQDPGFACCWFSRAIDLGDEGGNPGFWMLEKTAVDAWSLYFRRVSGQLAAYSLKSKSKQFPIKLKKGKTTKDFKWPATITICQRG